MLAVAVNCCKITKMTITIVKSRTLADKYSHCFITGLELRQTTTQPLRKLTVVSLKKKTKTKKWLL